MQSTKAEVMAECQRLTYAVGSLSIALQDLASNVQPDATAVYRPEPQELVQLRLYRAQGAAGSYVVETVTLPGQQPHTRVFNLEKGISEPYTAYNIQWHAALDKLRIARDRLCANP